MTGKKLIWFVEANLEKEISLDTVAEGLGLSRFHVTRLFGVLYGHSIMAYVRARRLSEAAKLIVLGDDDLLGLALRFGYGSHEAFGRAFRDHFGVPPSAVRDPHVLNNLTLTEALSTMSDPLLTLKSPRIETAPAMAIAGLSGTFDFNQFGGIPLLWQRFRDYFGQIDAQIGGVSYGVSYNYRPEGLDYMAGVEVSEGDLPDGFSKVRIEPQTYCVFEHNGHVSTISATWRAIYEHGLRDAQRSPVYVPSFERMDERFDGRTGTGVVEIWVPVAGA